MDSAASQPPGAQERLAFIREETRFEIGLLHDRVNALVGAEAFLTIAFTAAMSSGAAGNATFSAVASPILSALGLVLALLAWPGIDATVKIVLAWTARQNELLESEPVLSATVWGMTAPGRVDRRAHPDQWRSMLFFRAVPALFTLVWTALTVFALIIRLA